MVDTDNPPAAINAKVSGVNLVLITKISSNESSYRSSAVGIVGGDQFVLGRGAQAVIFFAEDRRHQPTTSTGTPMPLLAATPRSKVTNAWAPFAATRWR